MVVDAKICRQLPLLTVSGILENIKFKQNLSRKRPSSFYGMTKSSYFKNVCFLIDLRKY